MITAALQVGSNTISYCCCFFLQQSGCEENARNSIGRSVQFVEWPAGLSGGRRRSGARSNRRPHEAARGQRRRDPPAESHAKCNECQARRVAQRSFDCGLIKLEPPSKRTVIKSAVALVTNKCRFDRLMDTLNKLDSRTLSRLISLAVFTSSALDATANFPRGSFPCVIMAASRLWPFAGARDKAAKVAVYVHEKTAAVSKNLCAFSHERGARPGTRTAQGTNEISRARVLAAFIFYFLRAT